MAVLKVQALEGFLRKSNSEVGAVLIYGEDSGVVRDVAKKAVSQIAGSVDDPFSVTALDEDALSGDPARLADEVLSLPFPGSRRAVWVRGVSQAFLKAIEPVLDGSLKGNMIIAEAAALPKSSSLRSKFEASRHAMIVPLYEAETETMAGTIASELQRQGLRIDADARSRLIELAGRGGMALQREIEKLAVYCHGAARVTLEDVEAICGDSASADTADLADAVFAGDMPDADRFFIQLLSSGVDPGRILSSVHGHALRLIEYRQNIDRGMGIAQVVKSARPPIFFKRQTRIQNQLEAWATADLLQAAATLHAAMLEERLNSALGESLANRALLAVARMSRSLRVRMN